MNKKQIRLTETDFHKLIAESVKKALNEVKLDNPYEVLKDSDYEISKLSDYTRNGMKGGLEDGLAELIVDNNIPLENLSQYKSLMSIINPSLLKQEIENYKNFLKSYERDERRREAEAWAEERMSDMGFGFEGD